MSLSTRAKEAFKTAVAIVIAMGISLSMDWEKPYWAGYGVAMISLSTAGQSLNKGAMRMLGTLLAVLAALTFLAWFPQQRWCFMAVVSVYVGFCSYMMTGRKYQYFWYASGFICLVISVEAANSLTAFETAIERTQETGTGVLVYSLISALLWPRTTRGALEDATRKLWATQSRLHHAYRSLLSGHGTAEDARPLRMQEAQCLTQVGQLLNAAESDSAEVWAARALWRRFISQSTALMEALERWRQSFPEVQPLQLTKLLPNLEALGSELDLRFGQIERMLGGAPPERQPQPITLKVEHTELRALAHFQRAAVAVTVTHLERLEALTCSLFDCVQELKGYGEPALNSRQEHPRQRWPGLDADRLQGVVTVLATLWIGFLIWIYFDPPGHASFFEMATIFTMVCVRSRLAPTGIVMPLILGTFFAGGLYVFVMPHLSGYWELGSMIFSVSFGICYLFWQPRQGGAKTVYLAMFLSNIFVTNEQTYSFAAYANGALMIILICPLIIVTSYIPTSPHAEKAFLRMLRRFFRHCAFLTALMELDEGRKRGLAGRCRSFFYNYDVLELPEKLAAWGGKIDHRKFPDNSTEQVQALVAALRPLAFRIKDLLEVRGHAAALDLERELIEDIRAWRMRVEQRFLRLANNPAATSEPGTDIADLLEACLARMEARLDKTLAREEARQSGVDYERFYRLLGSYRGLSEAAIGYDRIAERINWAQWREARF